MYPCVVMHPCVVVASLRGCDIPCELRYLRIAANYVVVTSLCCCGNPMWLRHLCLIVDSVVEKSLYCCGISVWLWPLACHNSTVMLQRYSPQPYEDTTVSKDYRNNTVTSHNCKETLPYKKGHYLTKYMFYAKSCILRVVNYKINPSA